MASVSYAGRAQLPLNAHARSRLIALADPGNYAPPLDLAAEMMPPILEAANYHRVLSNVFANLGQELGAKVPDRFRDQLAADATRMIILRDAGERILSCFADEGIPAVIAKGENFARRLYPAHIWRAYTDIDLLIPFDRLAAARAALRDLGFAGSEAPIETEGFYAEDKWAHRRAGFEVLAELHWDLINSPKLRRGRRLTYADVVAEGSDTDAIGNLMIACVHGSLGHIFERLYHLIDIAQAARGAGGAINPSDLSARAQNCGLSDIIVIALTVTGKVLSDQACLELCRESGFPPAPEWVARLLNRKAVLTPRGGMNPLLSWRRSLLREWLKHRPARFKQG